MSLSERCGYPARPKAERLNQTALPEWACVACVIHPHTSTSVGRSAQDQGLFPGGHLVPVAENL